ncbi:Hint domain-containing protein [Celeribacter arenosi]|uniref:Hedgehog/Intein (Hint) domain-containing protein n=1 Tax=Celeribacter arenosi TaxID=792649 RepID=A0ABP7KAF8_9RHOB
MATKTIYVYDASTVTVSNSAGTVYPDVIADALWGDAFSWENPNDLMLTVPSSTTAIEFEDSDGLLQDDPFSGNNVIDQKLIGSVSFDGTTYSETTTDVRWQGAVVVESEYVVTLYDQANPTEMYTMVGVSITVGYQSTVVGVAFDGAQPPSGTVLTYIQGQSTYSYIGSNFDPDQTVPCFAAGTLIETPDGPRPVETLRAGDLVSTLDEGPKPILWWGASQVDGTGNLAPIRIAPGILGNTRDLLVSPNHRILLRGAEAELLFGEPSVLVPAKALVDGRTIIQTTQKRIAYHHILLSGHEIIFAEGIATESLFTGAMALAALDDAARAELEAIFPEHAQMIQSLNRPSLTVSEGRLLMAHLRNSAPKSANALH